MIVDSQAQLKETDNDSGVEMDFLDKEFSQEDLLQNSDFKPEIVWKNVVLFILLHIGALFGLYCIFFQAQWNTVYWSKYT